MPYPSSTKTYPSERGIAGMVKRRVAGIAERIGVEKGVVGKAERRVASES